ncbi:hypothetical protein BH09BAC1_BH09BAC1_03160 [soil metagenome]
MKRLGILSVLFAFIALVAWHPQDDAKTRYAKWKRQYAQEQIKALKGGTLLVRLHSRDKSVNLYRQNGQHEIANKIEDEQFQENKAIVAAFTRYFNFSKVYFFNADDTEKIKAGNMQGIFLNSQMQGDATIAPRLDTFMVAEFGPLEGETRVIPGDTLVPLPDYVSGEVLERALVIRDKNFMQMRDPFPYYIRGANRSKIEKQVTRLNERLQSYYLNATKPRP